METMDFKKLIEIIKMAEIVKKPALEQVDFVSRYSLDKFIDYLSPDSGKYFLTLNPVFSIELNFTSDTLYKKLQAASLRDGVMPLTQFYIKNPTPPEIGPIIIVDHELSSLVPPSWRPRTLLRTLYFNYHLKFDHCNKLILFISPMPDALPLDLVDEELEKIYLLGRDKNELLIYFSSAKLKGDKVPNDDKAWGYKILEKIFLKFKSQKIRILDWNEYLDFDLSGSCFYFMNPLRYFFIDSYVLHDATQRGSVPLVHQSLNFPEYFKHEISKHHGFVLHQSFDPYLSYGAENLGRHVFEIGASIENKKQNLLLSKFCTEEFRDWTLDIAQELYQMRKSL